MWNDPPICPDHGFRWQQVFFAWKNRKERNYLTENSFRKFKYFVTWDDQKQHKDTLMEEKES